MRWGAPNSSPFLLPSKGHRKDYSPGGPIRSPGADGNYSCYGHTHPLFNGDSDFDEQDCDGGEAQEERERMALTPAEADYVPGDALPCDDDRLYNGDSPVKEDIHVRHDNIPMARSSEENIERPDHSFLICDCPLDINDEEKGAEEGGEEEVEVVEKGDSASPMDSSASPVHGISAAADDEDDKDNDYELDDVVDTDAGAPPPASPIATTKNRRSGASCPPFPAPAPSPSPSPRSRPNQGVVLNPYKLILLVFVAFILAPICLKRLVNVLGKRWKHSDT